MMSFGLVVPQHVSSETIGHSYTSSVTQVVVGLELHRIESSWLTQLLAILLALNIVAIGLKRAFRLPNGVENGPARSPYAVSEVAIESTDNSLNDWLHTRLPRSGARLHSRHHASGSLGFRVESAILCLSGVAVLLAAAAIGARTDLGFITVVEGADDAARARFEASQIRNDAELPWNPPFDMECGRSEDSTMRGPRRCLIVWDGKRHEATVKPGTDLEFLGRRLTLVGLERLPLSGSLDLDIAYGKKERSRTTSAVGTPLDITLPDGRITALLGGSTDGSPVGVLMGQVGEEAVAGQLSISARPRTAMTFLVSGTDHIPFVWIGAGLLLIGILGITLLPAYRIAIIRTSDTITLNIRGYGALSRPERLKHQLLAYGRAGGDE